MDLLMPYRKKMARYGISGLGWVNDDMAAFSRPIAVGETKKVCVRLPLGIFEQEKYLPLKHAPIVLEMELNPNTAAYLNTTAPGVTSGSTTFTCSTAVFWPIPSF